MSQTSGDLIADRRYAFGHDLAQRGDHNAAADLFVQTIEAAPDFTAAWFALGEAREKMGDTPAAISAFRRVRELDPQDRHGASLHLIRLEAEPISDMPRDYVRTLYDQYAPQFENALIRKLSYRGPELLHDAVVRACAAANRPLHFRSMLDLGCGTGLGGEAFRTLTERLTGMDLSPLMIEQARAKGVYDTLGVGDIPEFLRAQTEAHARYDFVLAADVFIYLANLADIISGCAQILEHRGLFAFTVETHDGEGIVLGEKLRYAHSEVYVRTALLAAGLQLLLIEPASIRNEGGATVPGFVVVAIK